MFVYTGNLSWWSSAVDELLVVVLPEGSLRQGDEIYTYSQWTKDSKGNKHVKWFQRQVIDKVTRNEKGDDIFHFGKGYYSFKVRLESSAENLALTMSNPAGAESEMYLERMFYQPGKDLSNRAARIWTGSVNNTNELFVAIAPEGFGVGNPLLVVWQWTMDGNGEGPSIFTRRGYQEAETVSEHLLKFKAIGRDEDFPMTCTWDEKTEKLTIDFPTPDFDPQGRFGIGALDLATVITSHSEYVLPTPKKTFCTAPLTVLSDVTPPKIPGETVLLEVHYPTAEPNLPRIQTAMPFPPTLQETLAHTASFLDQAGYLAKYAVDRYHALDKSYHALNKQFDELTAQIRDLSGQVTTLTSTSEEEKKRIEELNKKLTETLDAAAQKEADLLKQVQDLQRTIAKEQTHDAEDHAALDAAHAQSRADQAALADLKKQTVKLQSALDDAAARNRQQQKSLVAQAEELSSLHGEISAEKTHNAELQAQNIDLKARVAALEAENAATKKTLARTTADLEEVRAESADKDKIIDGLETGLVAIKKDRDAKKQAYSDLEKRMWGIVRELQGEITRLAKLINDHEAKAHDIYWK
ncbi:hypothetical protein N0V88_005037 [Collariella sp. IMI 366227]|nr:hypothetical protein N0V88_005037 [Collariella sp. IMI 366227]